MRKNESDQVSEGLSDGTPTVQRYEGRVGMESQILWLQRSAGNAAVRQLVTQRGWVGRTSPTLQRSLADEMSKTADEGEQYNVGANEEEAQQAAKMSNVHDIESAKAAQAEVVKANGVLRSHMADGPATPQHTAKNDTTINVLGTLIDREMVQGTGISVFQQQYKETVKDYDRIVGAIQAYQKQYPKALGAEFDEQGKMKIDPQALGADAKKNLGMTDARAKILKDSQAKHEEHGNRADAEKSIADMKSSGDAVKMALENMNIQTTDLEGAQAGLNADIGRTPKDDDKAEATKLNTEIAAFKTLISRVLSAIKLVITHSPSGTIFTAEELKEAGREGKSAGETVTGGIEKIDDKMLDTAANAFFAGRAKLAQSLDGSALAKKEYNNTMMYTKKLEKSEQQLQQSIRLYKESNEKFKTAKAAMLKAVQLAGKEMDRLTGNKGGYEAGARLYGETKLYLGQIDVTLHAADQEQQQAAKVTADKSTVTAPAAKATGSEANPLSDAEKIGNAMTDPAGMIWFSWIPTPAYKKRAGLDKSGKGEIFTNHIDAFKLGESATATQTAANSGGANEVLQTLIADLKDKQRIISELSTALGNAMGMFGNKA